MSQVPLVKKHPSEEELEGLIKREGKKRLLERLIFIRSLYDGEGVGKAVKNLGRRKATGYLWLKRWNDGGFEGLRPEFRGGRTPKLSGEGREELKQMLERRDDWTTMEVRALIQDRFGIRYSIRGIRRILRSLGMKYGKPHPRDCRRPEGAGDGLKRAVERSLKDEKKVLVGFLDECRPQTDSNTQRIWSFGRQEIRKNKTRYKANTFGFHAPAGESPIDFKENSRKGSACEFLEEMRGKSSEGNILMILDNFSSHRAKMTQEKAAHLGMRLACLPPYSPDLNPIEQTWRGLKRWISTAFFRTREGFLKVIEEAYNQLSKRISYAEGWIQKFLPQQFNKLCP